MNKGFINKLKDKINKKTILGLAILSIVTIITGSFIAHAASDLGYYWLTDRKITLENAYDSTFEIRLVESGGDKRIWSYPNNWIPLDTLVYASSGYWHYCKANTITFTQSSVANQTLHMYLDTLSLTPYLYINKVSARPGYTLTKADVVNGHTSHYTTAQKYYDWAYPDTPNNNSLRDTTVETDLDNFKIYIGTMSKLSKITFTWENNKYTVTYNANGGTGTTANSSHTYDVASNLTANGFSRTGYTFNGWNTAADGSGTSYADKASVSTLTTTPNGTVTLYAQWKPNTYTVTLDGNNATSTTHSTSTTATYNAAMPTITLPSRSYKVTFNANSGTCETKSLTSTYTFNGYYTATSGGTQYYKSDGSSAKNYDKTSASTLYAQWTSKAVTLPTPTRTGYTFNGWYTASSGGTKIGDAGASYTPTAASTLYAQWTPNNYTYNIVYKSSSGVQLGTGTVTKTFDTTNTISPKAFTGYTSPANQSIKWDSTTAKTITFVYTPISYSVTYNLNGGTNPSSGVTTKYTIETATFNLPTPTRTGYTFKGWFTTSNFTGSAVTQVTKGSTGNKAFYAKWQANTYTIKFDANNKATTPNNKYGNAFTTDPTGSTSNVTATYDKNVTLTNNGYTRVGYKFIGWSKTASSKTAEYSDGQTLTKPNFKSVQGDSITLYAIWEPIVYTVQYDKGLTNSTTAVPSSFTLRFDQSGTLAGIGNIKGTSYTLAFDSNKPSNATLNPTTFSSKTGYLQFKDWSLSNTNSTAYRSGSTIKNLRSSEGTVTVTAQWDSETLNGYTASTLTGWTFQGWFTDKVNGTKTTSVTVVPSKTAYNEVLYAQWKANTYTIQYVGNDTTLNIYNDNTTTQFKGTTSETSATYDSPTKLAVNNFTKEGYVFKGWSLYKDWKSTDPANRLFASGATLNHNEFIGSNYAGGFTATQGDKITLYAIWEPIRYTIKFHSNDDSLGNWNATDSYTQTNVRFDQPTNLIVNTFKRTAPYTLLDGTYLTEGYDFIGWSFVKNDISSLLADKSVVTSITSSSTVPIDLYANWRKDITLSFNLNQGQYNKNASTIILSAYIYNDKYTYTFNISNNKTASIANKQTEQVGTIKAYGTTITNGENSLIKKFNSDGTNYRFLGWNFSSSDKVPYSQFDVFSDGTLKSNKNTRIYDYKIDDDTTLYAIYEPILKVTISIDRILGKLESKEVNKVDSIKMSDGKKNIHLTINAGEQAQYKVSTLGNVARKLDVVFDSRILDIYTKGNEKSPWRDTLNNVQNLNQLINPVGYYNNKFYIPMYLGTTTSYNTSNPNTAKNTKDYTIEYKVYQYSYYYNEYKDIDEQVQVTANIHLGDSNTGSGKPNNPLDTVIEELKTRLKIRFNIKL